MTAPRPLSYWVRTVDRMLDEQFEAEAVTAGLSALEWRLLDRLRTGAVADDSLGAALAPPEGGQSLEDALDRLGSKGYAEHQAAEYRLTDEGYAKAEEIEAAALARITGSVGDGLSAEDHDHLVATLERMARNLGWEPT